MQTLSLAIGLGVFFVCMSVFPDAMGGLLKVVTAVMVALSMSAVALVLLSFAADGIEEATKRLRK